MSGFWRNWFLGFCLSLLVFGVVLAGGAFPATSGPARFILALLGPTGDIDFDPPLRFSLAVLGAVSIGWAVCFHYTIGAAIELGSQGRPLWRGMTIAVIVWFAIDSSLSVATGFALNVIPNAVLMSMFFIGVRGSGVLQVGT